MAYFKEIFHPRCQECGRPAKVEIYSHRNALHGAFCGPHGKEALKRLQQWERGLEGETHD